MEKTYQARVAGARINILEVTSEGALFEFAWRYGDGERGVRWSKTWVPREGAAGASDDSLYRAIYEKAQELREQLEG